MARDTSAKPLVPERSTMLTLDDEETAALIPPGSIGVHQHYIPDGYGYWMDVITGRGEVSWLTSTTCTADDSVRCRRGVFMAMPAFRTLLSVIDLAPEV